MRRDVAAGRLPPVQPFHAMAYPFPADLALAIGAQYAQVGGLRETQARGVCPACGLLVASSAALLLTLLPLEPLAARALACACHSRPAAPLQYCLSVAQRLGVPRLPHPPSAPLAPGQRLRVGYVSSDFGNHPLSHLMGAVFGMHDRRWGPRRVVAPYWARQQAS